MTFRRTTAVIGVVVLALGLLEGEATPARQRPRGARRAVIKDRHLEAWEWLFSQRAYPLGYIPEGAKERALRQIEEVKAKASSSTAPAPLVAVPGDAWVNIGPAPLLDGQVGATENARPMSGRVGAVAIDPTDASHWLIGAAQGGVWETRDTGATWTPRTDAQASLAMGAIAFAPSDPRTIYAGSGEAVFTGSAYAGRGLLKSTDGGASWQLLATATFAGAAVSDIKVNPSNPSILVASITYGRAGRGGEFPPTIPSRGIFKSTDGGMRWLRKQAGDATDLEVDPTNFNNQYAGIGYPFGNNLNGVYRSTDAGDSWTPISGPWTTLVGGVGRVELAIAPSNANVLYVSIHDAKDGTGHDGGLLGLFKTTNAWASTPMWTQIPTGATDDGTGVHGYCGYTAAYPKDPYSDQCDYSHVIIVDPTNANVLYAGGVPLWKFDGASWTEVSKTVSDPTHGIHVDQHSMAFAGSRLVVGNDGGVWSTTDGGNTWADHNTNLTIAQFYDGSVHASDLDFALAGAQDNGTGKWTGTNAWKFISGGDGADNAISSSNPDTDWAVSSQSLDIERTTDGGSSFFAADSGIDKTDKTTLPFIARFEKCPSNDDVMIAGTNSLWKSTNFFSGTSASWSSNWDGEGLNIEVSALAFAPSDATCNTYALGGSQGNLRLTSNGGTNWARIDGPNAAPDRYVTDLAFDPTNANVLYVTLSGFDEGTPGQPGHVFKTTNALATSPMWSNVSPPVNLPHNTVVVDPSAPATVYVGTDVGVWKSIDGGGNWTPMGPETGMPNVAVFDLQINDDTGRLVAFTYGRGAFALTSRGCSLSSTVIPAAGGTLPGTTSGTSALEASCPGTQPTGPERIFQWTPAGSGMATIQTCGAGTNFDTVLYMRTVSCANSAADVDCNDDPPNSEPPCTISTGQNRGSRITPIVLAGQTYFIVVDGFKGAQGNFTLTVTPPPTLSTTSTTSTTRPSTTSTTTTSTTTTRPSTTTTSTTSTSTTSTSSTSPTSTTTTTTIPPGSTLQVTDCAAGPGATATCNVTLRLAAGVEVATLQFNATVDPIATAPPLATSVGFVQDPSLPPPSQNTNEGFATLLVGWFSPFNPHLTATRLLGTLSVPVPATAQGGQMYRLRIIAPSGTSDGSTDVPLAPGPDGKLTVGRRFLVCDVVPTRTDQNGDGDTADAGEFGNGTISNADVVAIFRASLLPGQQPPAGSDLFSAMDCSPEDAPPVCGGDATIRNNDIVCCFRRSLLPSLPRYERLRAGGCTAAVAAPLASSAVAASLAAPGTTAGAPATRDTQPAGSIIMRPALTAAPGRIVTVPVRLRLAPGARIATLQFAASITGQGSAPAVGKAPTFRPARGLPAPDLAVMDGQTLLLGWLRPLPARHGRRIRVGTLTFRLPGGAARGDRYEVAVSEPSGTSLAGNEVALAGSLLHVSAGGLAR